jgi:hypothetical protein
MRRAHFWAAALLLAAATSQAATLTVTPGQSVYQVGDLITLNVVGDAEGADSTGIGGRLLFDAGLATYVTSNQVQLQSDNGTWDDVPVFGGEGFAGAFNQRTVPFGFSLVPTNQLIATVVLEATGVGVLNVDWETEGGLRLNFFGLSDAPGTSVTIVPEPSTSGLLGLGLAAVAVGRRARGRRS